MAGLHVGSISCCLCGTPTPALTSFQGMCTACTATNVDITSSIERSLEVDMCKQCERWHRNPGWAIASLESAELLSLCLRKLRGLKHVRLVDASWIWTEPHSRRLKIKLTVAKDLIGAAGASQVTCLQQSLVVEYVVRTRNCEACNKVAAKDTWTAKVQVRQKAEHPRTLLALEQHMLKHQKSRVALRDVKREGDGLDFFFGRRQDAHRFAMGICSLAPCRCKASSSVIATNARTGTSNVKHVWAIEIAPLCRDDLVLLPKGMAAALSPLALVSRIGASIHLVDPLTAATAELTAETYWRNPFGAIGGKRQLSTFIVIDYEADAPTRESSAEPSSGTHAPFAGALATEGTRTGMPSYSSYAEGGSTRRASAPPASVAGSVVTSRGGRGGYVAPSWCPGEATVARASDFGVNDTVFAVRTHLSRLFEAGDEATGYDLEAIGHALDDPRIVSGSLELPEVVLVGKVSAKQAARTRERAAAGKSYGKSRRESREGGKRRPTRKPLDDGMSEVSSTTYQESISEEELLDLEGLDRILREDEELDHERDGSANRENSVGDGAVHGSGMETIIEEATSAELGTSFTARSSVACAEDGKCTQADDEVAPAATASTDDENLVQNAADWLATHEEDHTGSAADLNQYWYSAETVAKIARVIREQVLQIDLKDMVTQSARQIAKGGGSRSRVGPWLDVAFLSTPSLFFALSKSERSDSRLFDFDPDLGIGEPGYIHYDFRKPEAVPSELRHAFRAVVIDPPFITHDVWRCYVRTARVLLEPNAPTFVLGTTVIENGALLRDELGVHPHRYLPSIPNLPYQYAIFSNCDARTLNEINPEVPIEPDDLLSQAAVSVAAEREAEAPIRVGADGLATYDFEAMLEAALRLEETRRGA